MWTEIKELWLQRNHDRHNHDKGQRNVAAYFECEHELQTLYALRDSILPEDQRHYYADIEEHLGKPIREIKRWIRRWRPVLLKSATEAARIAQSSTKPIYDHFGQPKPRIKVKRPPAPPPRRLTQPPPVTEHFYIQTVRRSTSKAPSESDQNKLIRPLQQLNLFHLWPDHPG